MNNNFFMQKAIELALKAEGRTNPNPLVGAVIVKDNKIIGEGYHHKYGMLHAEREAIKDCLSKNNNPKDSTIYVTLEPCCHYGKQPPCTFAIKEAGIKKVVIGSYDPNPLVSGKGISFLRENGIIVEENFMKEECDKINKIFFHYITTKMPFVALKYAMTLDGKIATKTGNSKWITNSKSREHVHYLRNKYSSILVGINTVLKDDPLLNCRIPDGKNPIRIICDSSLKIPLESKIVQTANNIQTIIATCKDESDSKVKLLKEKSIYFIHQSQNTQINLNSLMQSLVELKIDSVLIEGGSQIHFSALKENIVNYVYCYIAPKIFGGINAKTAIGGEGVSLVEESFKLKNIQLSQFDEDFLIQGELI